MVNKIGKWWKYSGAFIIQMRWPDHTLLKDRITIAFCLNALGSHILSLFIMQKSAKPRDSENVNLSYLFII